MYKKAIIIALVVVVLAAGVYYREELTGYLMREQVAYAQKVSATVTYEVPSGEDTERFDVYLDENGAIVDLKGTNVYEPESEAQAHLAEFSDALLTRIKGKKLSELEEVDKVGTSSLTTEAFNSIIDDLQEEL